MALLCALAICAGLGWALRGGLSGQGRGTLVGMDLQGALFAALSIGAAVWFFGPMFGLAIILAVVIHEFGHVAAYRVAGHPDARFRLIPLVGGVAISDRIPDSQVKDFFITLMGPAIGIGPMLLAFAMVPYTVHSAPILTEFLLVFASVTGALNFFNMLPFWPLDGGRMLSVIAGSFWPPLAVILPAIMCGLLVTAAIALQSLLLFIFAVIGAQGLMRAGEISRMQTPISKPHAVLALAAYLAVAGTLLFGGIGFLLRFL
ncbi:MAG: metalloprotease [Alphaproteobacteria bacterium]|jgi:Zn-dependent protease|nr:metalloprotease [Alphaproteobacteria bacterium]